jgi:predicted HicB family RNase H-like nuclease
VPEELHQRAALYAEEHEMKLNAVVQEALREYLTQAE